VTPRSRSTLPADRRLPSGRHTLPREFVVSSQRDRLLDAMAEACAEHGYAAVSVAEVVRRAQVSRSAFYELVRDKEGCFLAAYDTILGRFVQDVVAACRVDGDELAWVDQMRVGLLTALRFMAAEPAFARMCVVDVFAAGPAALERYRSAVRVIATFVDAGRAETPGRADQPARVAVAVVEGAALVIRDEILAGRTDTLPDIAPDLLYTLLAPYLDRDEALRQVGRIDTTDLPPRS
jgi:AcrR family transcriptional regulator